ncbi:MAG: periplasmic protein TonB [Verrucomicrobiota bacterium]|jgi:protein TonB
MTRALLYRSRHKQRFGAALGIAAVIHVAAISLANIHRPEPATPSGVYDDISPIDLEPDTAIPEPPADLSDPLPTPPPTELSFIDEEPTPPPVRRQTNKFPPIVRPNTNTHPGSLPVSSAKAFALSAPRPEYPYEARRQKITGDGVVVMTVDSVTGNVISVSMSRTTGSPFLDNAALAGFKKWRFRPGTVSSVTCPVTFTLTGASY